MINEYTLMEINNIHSNFLANPIDSLYRDYYSTNSTSTAQRIHKKKFANCTTNRIVKLNCNAKNDIELEMTKCEQPRVQVEAQTNERVESDTSVQTIPTQVTVSESTTEVVVKEAKVDQQLPVPEAEAPPQTVQQPTIAQTNDSLLSDCEVQINETEEYKRLNVRRALSVKVANVPEDESGVETAKQKHEKKVVRFADALGLDLVSVKMIFNPDLPPCIPRKVLDNLRKNCKKSLQNNSDSTKNPQNTITNPQFKYYNDVFDEDDDYYDEDNIYNNASPYVTKRKAANTDLFQIANSKYKWNKLFEQPGILPDFYIKLNEKKLSLESVYLKSNYLNGIIRVLNICYHKIVKLRYTTDNWKTQQDVNATYIENSCDGLTDRFNFNINLDLSQYVAANGSRVQMDDSVYSKLFTLEFAVSYETLAPIAHSSHLVTFWDSNNGQNYKIELLNLISSNDGLRNSEQQQIEQHVATKLLVSDIFDLSNHLTAAFV